ncbi:MAG: hypothetical protein V3T60_01510 [Candidatus Binatia bacterium]
MTTILIIVGASIVFFLKDEIDFVIALHPFPGVDSTLGSVPLIGHWSGGIMDSLLVASLHIRGPIEDPRVTAVSLSTLPDYIYGLLGLSEGLVRHQEKQPK